MKPLAVAAILCVATSAVHAQLSQDSKQKLAAMINLSGQLCAQVNTVASSRPDVYMVSCTRYRDGTGVATYEVNLKTGAVK